MSAKISSKNIFNLLPIEHEDNKIHEIELNFKLMKTIRSVKLRIKHTTGCLGNN